jgi:hypothetical protein
MRAETADQTGPGGGEDARLPLRWAAYVFVAGAIWLVPWALGLALVLPAHELRRNWNVAWTGYDLVLAVLLAATAFAVLRRRAWLPLVAVATATLLLADAWFDLATAGDRGQLLIAAGLAAGAEIPGALLCLWVARAALRPPYVRETKG